LTIHGEHPFRPADSDEVRRLRARVGATVSLWTSGEGDDAAGLTVSSYVVVNGEPGRIVGALDPDADLTERLTANGRAVVQLLAWRDRDLAEMFGGTMPAPGGPFGQAEFVATPYGPRLARATTWAHCSLESSAPTGWSDLVTLTIDEVAVGEADWLVHEGGRFRRR
jgi:flavin reductase (DIM6/NTAB) family NADH-FMN oxidoreductase RutF